MKTLLCLMNTLSGQKPELPALHQQASKPGVGCCQRWQLFPFVYFLSKDFRVLWGFFFFFFGLFLVDFSYGISRYGYVCWLRSRQMTLEGNQTFSCQLVPQLFQRQGREQRKTATLASGLATHVFNILLCAFNCTLPSSIKEQFPRGKTGEFTLFFCLFGFFLFFTNLARRSW